MSFSGAGVSGVYASAHDSQGLSIRPAIKCRGDLTIPGRLSILDGKHPVVGEYAANQRISLFDLDGKFVKIVRTVFRP